MSGETVCIDKEPDLSALDSVLFKYGSSSSAHKKQPEVNQFDSEGACEIQPPSKSFLQEIQERAQILSCQRERSAKHILHNVVAGNQDNVQTDHSNLDDFVKLLRAAPIGEESHYQPVGLESDKHSSNDDQGAVESWSLEVASRKAALWNPKSKEGRDRHPLISDSEPTVSEESSSESETDSDESDDSDFNFTWEVNTEHPDRESLAAESAAGGYFQLEGLEESEPLSGSAAGGYFQLSALDDNIAVKMADGEPSVPVLVAGEDDEVQQDKQEDEVIALSDEEQMSDKEEVVMDVEESRKSFATLEDDKALDGYINEVNDKQSKSELDDSVVSGDETVKTKAPSDEEDDWVFLAKDEDAKDDTVEADGHQDKKLKTDHEEEAKIEEEAKTEEGAKTEDEELNPDDGDAVLETLKDDPEVEETDGNPDPPSEQTPEKSPNDDTDDKAPSPEGVVLRQKPHGAHNIASPQQRYSLPEFALFDSAKTLDTEMLKSRARLGKQGALAQRRKPKKPSSQDPSKRQTWMFGDPNDTSQLKGIAEEAEKDHKKGTRLSAPELPSRKEEQTSPKTKPKKPVGGMGGPMLLVGMGGPAMLKKTGKKSPMEEKPVSKKQEEPTKSKPEPPRIIKPKPARPTPAGRPSKSDAPPSWMKPIPKSETSKPDEKPNGEILKAQEETNKDISDVPAWEAEKRLPPISPRLNEATVKETKPHKKEVKVPLWKQELMKKKKEGDAGGGKKRYSLPPPVAKKPDTSDSPAPFTTMPQWQVDLAEKKIRKKKGDSLTEPEPSMATTEIEIKDETTPPKLPTWKIEAAEREKRQREEKAKLEKARDEKLKEFEQAKKEELAPLSPLQKTTQENGNNIITKKDSSEEDKEEKKDKPKHSGSWKEEANENTQKKKDMDNKKPKPKVPSKKPVLSPKPKPSNITPQTYNSDMPQWKKDLAKKRRTSDWRNRLRSASIDHNNPPSPTSNSNEESNRLNDNQTDENSTDKNQQETKRHTICTITGLGLPVKSPRNPPSSNVPQWKIELEQRNRRLSDRSESSVPDN